MKKIFFFSLAVFFILCSHVYSEERGLNIIADEISQNTEIGKQYFLIIGIDSYEQWIPLNNPVNDAKEIRNIILRRYYADEVIEIYNEDATKANIIKTFQNLQEKLEIHDSLMIYYAGHGHLDETTSTGFWIPVNAGTDQFEQANWLPNSQILGLIENIKASHICVISDSCFSGDLLNTTRGLTTDVFDIPYFKEAYQLTSRQILTSGAMESVPDQSEFSKQFKMALEKNTGSYIDPLMIYNQVRLGVTETLPLFGSLKGSGHQNGASFILFLKENEDLNKSFLRISSERDGTLYINNKPAGAITPGVSIILNYEPDSYDIEIIYEDSTKSARTAELDFGNIVDINFEAENRNTASNISISDGSEVPLPIIDSREEDKGPNRFEKNYFSTGAGMSFLIPAGSYRDLYEIGFCPVTFFNFNFSNNWGIISIGFVTGAVFQATEINEPPEYNYVAVPLAASVEYATNFGWRYYMFIKLSGGISMNFIKYFEGSTGDDFITAPFMEPSLGGGFYFTQRINLYAYCGLKVIFIEDMPYLGLTPGFCLSVNF
jgi:hypothetical protein